MRTDDGAGDEAGNLDQGEGVIAPLAGVVATRPPRCDSIFGLYSVPCEGWVRPGGGKRDGWVRPGGGKRDGRRRDLLLWVRDCRR